MQVEGVKFLYEATQGLRAAGMHGCILADEMVRCRPAQHTLGAGVSSASQRGWAAVS